MLPEGSPLRGRVAVANAAVAFSLYEKQSAAPLWPELAAAGASPQRPLWASTGTKNPDYSDLLYVDSLIAPGTVNTMPLATLDAFADHGDSDGTIVGVDVATDTLRRASAADVDLNRITADLERAGVESFCASYGEILDLHHPSGRRASRVQSGAPVARFSSIRPLLLRVVESVLARVLMAVPQAIDPRGSAHGYRECLFLGEVRPDRTCG